MRSVGFDSNFLEIRLLRFLSLSLAAGAVLTPTFARAQISSSAATVTLNAQLAEVLTLSATPANVSFTLVNGGAATASAPVVISTNWVLGAGRSAVNVYAWFATPSAALSDGGSPASVIPSSAVYGQVTSGTPTTYTAFTQTNALGSAAGGLQLFSQVITAANRASSRSDNLNLKIDLTGQPQLPAGSYQGTLTLQAQSL